MKNILILGGGGFIGSAIAAYLINRNDCRVTVADLKKSSIINKLEKTPKYSNNLRIVTADLTKMKEFSKIDESYDEIYMLAAIVGVNKTLRNPEEVIRANTMLTMNTLEFVSKNPVRKILFSSSSENYAGTSDLFNISIPTDEKVPLCISDVMHPRWTYAVTKMHGESAFIHSSKSLDFSISIVRYQNIIGPEMGFGHAIPHIVERFVKHDGSPFKIYGHDQTRAFCYVDDAVRGTVLAMENQNRNPEIYHIGNDQEISMEILTKFIGKIFKYDGMYEKAETYPGSVSRRCPDITKARNELGYVCQFSWEEAVSKTVNWYKEYFESGNTPINGGFETPESIMKKF